jgi:transposase
MCGRRLSTRVSRRLKKGTKGRKDETRQGNKDHGGCRSERAASRCLCRECQPPRSDAGYVHLATDGCSRRAAELVIGDNAYDSDCLDAEVRLYDIELIAPHSRNRKNPTQDRRRLKRYERRWKIERLFAWLQNFRRLVVRYERHAENFLGMLQLASSLILLRHL